MTNDKTIKVSAVSYLNTKPFIWGLQKTGLLNRIDLSLDIPAQTAHKLLHKEVDLGLVPVAIIPQLPQHFLVSDYCIGAVGSVQTVCLYSQVPLNEIKTILLDYHSRTSVKLVQLLCKHYWQLNVDFVPTTSDYYTAIKGTTAGLIIGDRTITWGPKFNYAYDLGEAWYNFTQLPFVFAAWISTQKLPDYFINQLNHAFKIGVQNIAEIAANYQPTYGSTFDVKHYLSHAISYPLDTAKKQGLQQFLSYNLKTTQI